MAPSRYDWKIVDWDVKPQHNQPNMERGFTLLCHKERIASFGVSWLTVSVKRYSVYLYPVLQFTATNYQEPECHVIWHRLFVELNSNFI